MSEGYNGWRNWETWSWYLIISNDESLQSHIQDMVEDYCKYIDFPETRDRVEFREWLERDVSTGDLEELLKSYTLECIDQEELTSPLGELFLQFCQGCISEVDWREIARHEIEAYWEDNK